MTSTTSQMLTETADALMAQYNHSRQDFMAEAFGWLMDCGIVDEETGGMTELGIIRCVHREYGGGLAAFAASF